MMKANLTALVCGIIFGFGLCLSEMINPAVVIAFLDITGEWNPALLFVMAGALLTSVITFRFILKCSRPVCVSSFDIPQKKELDQPLIVGAVIFGIGWGLAGICPGPAVASLGLHIPQAGVFFISLLAGTALFQWRQNKKSGS